MTSVIVKSSLAGHQSKQLENEKLARPVREFEGLGISPVLLTAVQEIVGVVEPTEIQAASIPALIHDRKSDFILASHTGSGKTLAYLLPLVHALKEEEAWSGVPIKPGRPRALVLGPTRELAEQIHAVCKSLSHVAKFRTVLATGSGEMSSQRMALQRPLDILVATPARVVQHASRGNMYYGDVQCIVLDEADTMLDRGFGLEVGQILEAVRSKRREGVSPARCILVSATMSKAVKRLITEQFPNIRTIETSTLHRGVQGAKHIFLPVIGTDNKLDMAMRVVEGDVARGHRVMVFCNTLDSCRAAEHRLREQGLSTVCYHGDVPLEERKEALVKFSSEEVPILVATDLAARGLDIPGRVDHVVNFDFPLNPIDYLHRTGRTARAGASGKITSLVAKSDRVLAQRIEEALGRGLPLDQLSASKASLPPHMRPKPETLARRAAERKASLHSRRGRSASPTVLPHSSRSKNSPATKSQKSASSASKITRNRKFK